MTTQTATYSPEDNKLRLYVGRVPRDEYLKLKAEGWTSTPKQGCDFVAVWTPSRHATALEYSEGVIEDEDQGPEDRAADRAERFGEYRDKRHAEATGHADRYDDGPAAHGFQSQARAERAAARHDRIAGHAVDAWQKAEYWQRRTAGVISHALHLSSPGVRMGRIKTIEAEQRKTRAAMKEYCERFKLWQRVSWIVDPVEQYNAAMQAANYSSHGSHYRHPRPASVTDYVREHGTSLYSLLTQAADPISGKEAAELWLAGMIDPETTAWQESTWMQWDRHFSLRLAYENQMLEAQGGRAAFVEMEVGGWIGSHQIRKVNKSNATGRVVSVTLKIAGDRWGRTQEGFHLRPFNVERLPAGVYRAPSAHDLATLTVEKQREKDAAPKADPCPLINPTDEEAERLQAILNAAARADHCRRHLKAYGKDYADDFKASSVCVITQAQYSAVSKGSFARAETRGLCRGAELEPRASNMYSSHEKAEEARRGPALCKLRTTGSDGSDYGARRVIVLKDKPRAKFPATVWPVIAQAAPASELFALETV